MSRGAVWVPNPFKPWKNQRKNTNNQGKSLLKINQGILKNQGKEGPGGSAPCVPPFELQLIWVTLLALTSLISGLAGHIFLAIEREKAQIFPQ